MIIQIINKKDIFPTLQKELQEYVFGKNPLILDGYYNNDCGILSSILSRLLSDNLKNGNIVKKDLWDFDNWIDDSLLTKVVSDYNSCKIWGIMIWGKANTTEQWTDPFYFERTKYGKINILFQDKERKSLKYSIFINSRGVWDKDFYLNPEWNIKERKWNIKFIFQAR